MEKLVLVIHILAALVVIGLVLLQHGKGADMGASFGSGSSGSLFGVTGSANFLSHATAIFVFIFFCTSISLAYLASHKEVRDSVVKSIAVQKSTTQSNAKAAVPADAAKTATPTGSPANSEEIPK